jgi:hypothetical protein
MKSFLISCYPAFWRARYGDEFEAILDERPLGPFDVADILLGALDAQLRLRGRRSEIAKGRGISVSLRIGGIAAIIGATLLAAAGFLSYGLVSVDGTVTAILLLTGLAVLLVALAGLSAFQARAHPRLIWGAFALTAIGTIVAVIGSAAQAMVGEDYWAVGVGGLLAALVGSALFAIATYLTATLSRAGAVLLGIGSILPFVGLNLQPVYLVSVICFLLGWFALGVRAIRLDAPANAANPA